MRRCQGPGEPETELGSEKFLKSCQLQAQIGGHLQVSPKKPE